jgi:hypothetical protein
MNPDPIKPSASLRPRAIADHIRAIEVHEAIGRRLKEGFQSIPLEWVNEFVEIINRYQPKP